MQGYTSPGQAAARGIVAGTEMGLRIRRENLLEDEVARRNKIQDEERAYLTKKREREDTEHTEDREFTEGTRYLQSIDEERKNLTGQVEQLGQQYGSWEKVPPEIQQKLTPQIADVKRRRAEAASKLYAPVIQKYEKKAREIINGLQNKTLDLNNVSDADFARAITGAWRDNPQAFMRGPNGEPSQIGAAIQQVNSGMQNGDHQSVIEGANVIYGPSMNVGIGSEGPEGTEIVSKRIVQLVPAPDGKGFIPAMSVQVKDPWGRQLEKDSYIAPPTHGRGMSGDVMTLDVRGEMDKLGQLGILEEMLNHPEVRAKLERGMKQIQPEMMTFIDGVGYLNAKPPKTTTHDTPLGGQTLQTTRSEGGGIVSERYLQRTATPGELERTKAAGIRASGVGQGRIVPEEYDETDPETGETRKVTRYVQVRGATATPVKTAAGDEVRPPPKASGIKGPTEDKIVASEVEKFAGDRGWIANKDSPGGWTQANGKPLTEDMKRELSEFRARARRDGKGAADKPDVKPKLAKAEIDTERSLAAEAIAAAEKAGNKNAVAKIKAAFQQKTGIPY